MGILHGNAIQTELRQLNNIGSLPNEANSVERNKIFQLLTVLQQDTTGINQSNTMIHDDYVHAKN